MSKPIRIPGRLVMGQPSWRLRSDTTELHVTETGGHMAPVTFDRKGRKIQPYSVAPWAKEEVDRSLPPIIRVLRGDFFCLPFGANETRFRGEQHPVHGEPANNKWTLRELSSSSGEHVLSASMRTKVRKGRVDKQLRLIDGQSVIYSQHTVSEMSGAMNAGHHATLRFPDAEGAGKLTTSRLAYAQTAPLPAEHPHQKGYSILKPNAAFRSLSRVPTLYGEAADLSRYPARRGFEDIAQLVNDPSRDFAWCAVTFAKQRGVWFSLKNTRTLASTLLWMSNGGRHYEPWSGRHVNVMGLEDLTSYFHYGLAESANKNPLSARGFATTLKLSRRMPTRIPYIQGYATVPSGFREVKAIDPADDGRSITLVSPNNKRVELDVDFEHLEIQ